MDADVVIAGAGPNGLMLACELRLAGVRPIVLERLPERQRGAAGQRPGRPGRPHARPSRPVRAPQRQARPAANRSRASCSARSRSTSRTIEQNPVYMLPVPQRRIEEVLQERALELGAEIRRGHELIGFAQDADSVTVEISGPDGPYHLHGSLSRRRGRRPQPHPQTGRHRLPGHHQRHDGLPYGERAGARRSTSIPPPEPCRSPGTA